MGGLSIAPPSNTIISSSISCVERRLVRTDCGTIASVKREWCLLSFFLACRLQRWRAFLVVGCSVYQTEAPWVQRDEVIIDFPNTCTQEGTWQWQEWEEFLWGEICSIRPWQLSTSDRTKQGRWGQWTLSVVTANLPPGSENPEKLSKQSSPWSRCGCYLIGHK